MSEQDATHYKDAEKIEESLDVRRPLGLDERLAALAEEVLKGKAIERSWDAVRMLHFPERLDTLADQEAAAVELSDWARRRGIEIEFRKRAAA